MVEGVGRSVETILEEWRALERILDHVSGDARDLLEARIAAVRDEHRAAVAALGPVADELRLLPHV